MENENNSQFSTLNSPLVLPGYKQTEVGVIPEDWEVKRSSWLTESFINQWMGTGHIHSKARFRRFRHPIRTANNVRNGMRRSEQLLFHPKQKLIHSESVLVARGRAVNGSTIGNAAWLAEIPICIHNAASSSHLPVRCK